MVDLSLLMASLRPIASIQHQLLSQRSSTSVLAMLLATKYADGLPFHRFEKVLVGQGIDISHQTQARSVVIQFGGHFQPLLSLMRDSLLASCIIH